MTKKEESKELSLDFLKLEKVGALGQNVIPCAIQDADSKEILNIAYVNQQALNYTLEHGIAAFWSTSRNEMWVKGMTSGDVLEMVDVRINCEQNSLVYIVRPKTGAQCHTGRASCYYRSVKDLNHLEFLND